MVSWEHGRVSTRASVQVPGRLSGAALRDSYEEALPGISLGLIRLRGNSVRIGPIELLCFGPPKVTKNAVDWPIEGGLLAGGPGGHWRIESAPGVVRASVGGYRPALPRPIYDLTHLQVHQLFTRLYLLRLRGPEPAPGVVAPATDRVRAAAVDVAFCLTLAGFTGRRRLGRTLAITAAYHVACWSLTGRTLGGLVLRQRVVSVDGSRLTPAQAAARLALVPLSLLLRRPVHDVIAGTEVIAE